MEVCGSEGGGIVYKLEESCVCINESRDVVLYVDMSYDDMRFAYYLYNIYGVSMKWYRQGKRAHAWSKRASIEERVFLL